MRLLTFDSNGELSSTENIIEDIPRYAILSHTWGADGDEFTFNDLKKGSGKSKNGYAKIQLCGEYARNNGLQYFWVDTCCIDKTNHTELSEAIASMFRWYRNAEKCYVYLSDVSVRNNDNNQTGLTWESAFRKSRWFTRGWTLQELLAPESVEFISQEGELLGDKNKLEQQIHEITGIPITALRGTSLSHFSVDERMKWAVKRQTKRKEDKAYSLMGIFNVFIPLIYGEEEHAFTRLKKEIEAPSGKYDRGLILFDAPDIGESLFIGRESELQDMERILQPESDSPCSSRKILILGGMGGIGKTQLAISYAKQNRYSYSSIFWLNANTESTLNNSLRAMASRIFPPETVSKLDDEQLWAQASGWLCHLDNTRWLLIFDNYDDPEQYAISEYYPAVAHGSIIITTRQPGRVNGEIIKLRSIAEKEQGLRILATRSGRENVELDAAAHQLAKRLDGYPLALATAGAFLSQSTISFAKYLQQYEAKWKVIDSIKGLSDYPSRTLYSTWDLSFAQIQQQNMRAANLLRFLAYLDHQDIWYDLLHIDQYEHPPAWFMELVSDEFVFEDAIQTLTRYCLVEPHHQRASYSLHTCVHDWVLDGLNRPIDVAQYWLAVDCVAAHINDLEWRDLSALELRRFNPHAERLAINRFELAIKDPSVSPGRLGKLTELADLLAQQVRHNAAEQMYQRALAGYEKVLEPDHASTLLTVNNLGALYADQGKLEAAEQMYQRALAGNEKVFGPEHPSTLQTVHSLGGLYIDQSKLDAAEQMYQRALDGRERALGPEHTSTLDTVNNLGILYRSQGKLEAAEQMYQRALAGYEKALGPDHASTVDTVDNLGSLYRSQGKLGAAEQMYQRALAGNEKALGPDHASTLQTVNNLGALYADQGKLDAAEQMYQRALVGYEKAFGPDHTSTLQTVDNLGSLCIDQDKLDAAEQMYQRALDGRERALGPDHTSTLDTINNLGILYRSQGKLEAAEQMYQRALAGYEKALGPDHASTVDTVDNLGSLYRSQGKLGAAEQMYQRALAGNEKALGPDHTSTLQTVDNLGSLYADQGKLDAAEQMYQRALDGKERALGPDHTSTLQTVNNLGSLYTDQGKLYAAEQMYQRALAGRERALGPDHTSTLRTVNDLGSLYADQGKPNAAEQMYRRALAGNEKALGPDHTSTLDTVNNLGRLYWSQGKLGVAEQMYQRALAGYENALGPDHMSTLDTVNNLGLLCKDQGKLDVAEQMYQRALAGYEKAALSHTISALNTVRNLGLFYRDQGKIVQARTMFQRAALGRDKMLGPRNPHTLEAVNDLIQLDARTVENEDHDISVGQKPLKKRNRWKNLLRLKG